jgi:hypothetical protein
MKDAQRIGSMSLETSLRGGPKRRMEEMQTPA